MRPNQPKHRPPPRRPRNAAPHRNASRFPRAATGLAALGLAVAAAAAGWMPMALAGLYVGLSALAYVTYLFDKTAAERGGRRTPESTLHLFALLGGWPGALVAQQQFRHKTIKRPFQAMFWATVAMNLVLAGWLLSSGNVAAAPAPMQAIDPTPASH